MANQKAWNSFRSLGELRGDFLRPTPLGTWLWLIFGCTVMGGVLGFAGLIVLGSRSSPKLAATPESVMLLFKQVCLLGAATGATFSIGYALLVARAERRRIARQKRQAEFEPHELILKH